MIEINVVNFITVGLMAMVFFAIAEIAKKKLGMDKDDNKSAAGGA